MLQQNTLHPAKGFRKTKKRVGRGDSSGHGSFSGRGVKGQQSRSGRGKRLGFEGGQTPLHRRIPKFRGFLPPRRTIYQILNVQNLEAKFDAGETVDLVSLYDRSLIRQKKLPVKILGGGELKKKLTVKVDKCSASAKEKIEKAGGTVVIG